MWKIEIKEGDVIQDDQILSILEAMKLEIPVKSEDMKNFVVEKLLVKPNDVVTAGQPLILLRKPGQK